MPLKNHEDCPSHSQAWASGLPWPRRSISSSGKCEKLAKFPLPRVQERSRRPGCHSGRGGRPSLPEATGSARGPPWRSRGSWIHKSAACRGRGAPRWRQFSLFYHEIPQHKRAQKSTSCHVIMSQPPRAEAAPASPRVAPICASLQSSRQLFLNHYSSLPPLLPFKTHDVAFTTVTVLSIQCSDGTFTLLHSHPLIHLKKVLIFVPN